MGTFHVSCEVSHHAHRARTAEVRKILVDTRSEHTWIARELLQKLGVAAEKKDVGFMRANGQTPHPRLPPQGGKGSGKRSLVKRDVGFAIVRAAGQFTIDEVVFAHPGDLQLLGARTLEGLNLHVDARNKKLVAAGPITAA